MTGVHCILYTIVGKSTWGVVLPQRGVWYSLNVGCSLLSTWGVVFSQRGLQFTLNVDYNTHLKTKYDSVFIFKILCNQHCPPA